MKFRLIPLHSDGTTHTYIPSQATEASSGSNGSDTSTVGTLDDAGTTLDSGSGASAEAATDSLEKVKFSSNTSDI